MKSKYYKTAFQKFLAEAAEEYEQDKPLTPEDIKKFLDKIWDNFPEPEDGRKMVVYGYKDNGELAPIEETENFQRYFEEYVKDSLL